MSNHFKLWQTILNYFLKPSLILLTNFKLSRTLLISSKTFLNSLEILLDSPNIIQHIIKLNQTDLNSSKTFQINLDQIQKTLTLSGCCYIKWPSIEMRLSPFTAVPLNHSSDHYYWRYCRFLFHLLFLK